MSVSLPASTSCISRTRLSVCAPILERSAAILPPTTRCRWEGHGDDHHYGCYYCGYLQVDGGVCTAHASLCMPANRRRPRERPGPAASPLPPRRGRARDRAAPPPQARTLDSHGDTHAHVYLGPWIAMCMCMCMCVPWTHACACACACGVSALRTVGTLNADVLTIQASEGARRRTTAGGRT